jgi:hypothetical protein
MRDVRGSLGIRLALLVAGTVAWLSACSSDDDKGASGAAGSGGAVTGSTSGTGGSGGASGASGGADTAGSGGAAGLDGSSDAGGPDDDAEAACGGPVPTSIADTHCATPDGGRGDLVGAHDGTEADDDNCLFHVKMTVPCVTSSQPVNLTFEMWNLGTTNPATGAAPYIEATIGYHPAPNTNPMTTETDGAYTIGPILFDRTGRWTITFHFYDAIPSMHSHVSFHLDVP